MREKKRGKGLYAANVGKAAVSLEEKMEGKKT